MKSKKTVALMGNPNVGKSTVFNEITGSRQHTGNWIGKTVEAAKGKYYYKFINYELVDLPGTYSLLSSSEEERIARDYLCFKNYDCVVVVVDSTALMKNLNLVYQIMEVTDKIVLLLNLADEAKKKNITIDKKKLSEELGIPVVVSTARSGKGINELIEQVHLICTGLCSYIPNIVKYPEPIENAVSIIEKELKCTINTDKNIRFFAMRLLENNCCFNCSFNRYFGDDEFDIIYNSVENGKKMLNDNNINQENFVEEIMLSIHEKAQTVESKTVKSLPSKKESIEKKLDKILLGKYTSVPVMLIMLGVILWLTIVGSNYPSSLLRELFDNFQLWLKDAMVSTQIPSVLISVLVDGILKVLLWVVAVMLPPMAIFFPLFALLEDIGILPRFAFNLDKPFECCGACGKQALTTCMGFGCNAVGITGCRIIDSPRERLVAIITNSLTPCNGRFPLLIAIIAMFFCKSSIISAVILLCFILLSMAMTFISSKVLTSTVLKGVNSSLIIELPSYKKPRFFKIIGDTLREKILFVLMRAVVISAPAGLLIWMLANITVGNTTLLCKIAEILDPLGRIMGLDGVMLIAFILSFPANEITIPIALMTYLSTGEMTDYSSLDGLRAIFVENGWTNTTAICTCIFSMFHFPCSTTLLTICKETKSVRWTMLSVLTPLICGFALCTLINLIGKIFI